MHDGGWPLRRVWEVCDTYGKLGRPIHFTETTIVSGPRKGPGENWGPTTPELEAKQADYVPKFYTTLFAHPGGPGDHVVGLLRPGRLAGRGRGLPAQGHVAETGSTSGCSP